MNGTTDTTVASGGKDRGFTLVELLIVIVILGVLATVTVFAVRGVTDRGKESACDADRNTLETAIESYFAQNDVETIPPTADDATTTNVDESEDAAYTLVGAQLLRSASKKYTVESDGTLTAISGSGCTV